MIRALVLKMQDELSQRHEGYVHRFEDLLAQIADLRDPGTIGQLLPLFDDESECDEVMFSLIHTMEVHKDAEYIREIVNHLESFFAHSPRWTIVVAMRILNSQSTLTALADQIAKRSTDQKQVVRNVLEAVRGQNGKFNDRCDFLLSDL